MIAGTCDRHEARPANGRPWRAAGFSGKPASQGYIAPTLLLGTSKLARCALCCALLACLGARPAAAASPFLYTPPDAVREASGAFRYANMTVEEALAELDKRGVPYAFAEAIPGVVAPIRLTGPLHGVELHSSLPPEQRSESVFEILDARLALALDDFCALLERHDVVELVHYTMYRPNGPKPGEQGVAKRRDESPRDKEAPLSQRSRARADEGRDRKAQHVKTQKTQKKTRKRGLGKGAQRKKNSAFSEPSRLKQKASSAKDPAKKASASKRKGKKKKGRVPEDVLKPTWSAPGTRHPAGLAIDVGGFRKRDGRWLSVGHHFEGRLGTKTCGPGTHEPRSAEGRELRAIICEAAELGLFTYVLTPNFDKWHADHFHMEIRGDVKWFLYH